MYGALHSLSNARLLNLPLLIDVLNICQVDFFISFVHEYAEQFTTEDFDTGNEYVEKYSKSFCGKLECDSRSASFPSKLSMFRICRGPFQHLFKNVVRYTESYDCHESGFGFSAELPLLYVMREPG